MRENLKSTFEDLESGQKNDFSFFIRNSYKFLKSKRSNVLTGEKFINSKINMKSFMRIHTYIDSYRKWFFFSYWDVVAEKFSTVYHVSTFI